MTTNSINNKKVLQKHQVEKEFENLIKEYEFLIYKVCRVYAYTDADRQDLFQDIVMQLWQAYPRFKGESSVTTWLYRVALNTSISRLRKSKRNPGIADLALALEQLRDSSTHYEDEEKLRQMYKAIEQLTEIEKALVMLYMEDRSYQEMEDILGIVQGTLRVKMNRIKEKLRQLTKKY
mgnify:CR=1 FL=1